VKSVGTDDVSEIGFIHTALPGQNRIQRNSLFQSSNGVNLYRCRNLGIGNHRGKKKRVCVSTGRTANPSYSEDNDLIRELYLTLVGSVENKSARESTGAGDLV
jgi:hypothetical protein